MAWRFYSNPCKPIKKDLHGSKFGNYFTYYYCYTLNEDYINSDIKSVSPQMIGRLKVAIAEDRTQGLWRRIIAQDVEEFKCFPWNEDLKKVITFNIPNKAEVEFIFNGARETFLPSRPEKATTANLFLHMATRHI
ncbi:hypothetical protein HPP92_012473 [Vanilla planifolia]|uniref:Uncharacterized protein n=1 Tax=Vanilla planifolia TaxID=51239 RepID=A0A835QS69_VANPL|nr:hypothetical protein HPP92_012473 [Vanilla planifolia]